MTYMPLPVRNHSDAEGDRFLLRIRARPTHVFTDGSPHPAGFPDFWMGDSRGRWEGDTLVVDVTNLDERTWLDHAGNFHSDALHVVERYTPIDASHLVRGDLEDPKVFSRPWKISMPLYRRIDKNVKILEYVRHTSRTKGIATRNP